MFFSGIADEAGQDIHTQIRAHQVLGWQHIELRLVDGTNITQITDDAFRHVQEALAAAEMQVSCFGSAIGNWARPITSDFSVDVEDLRRALPRMKALGTPFIRVMSYPNDPKNPISENEWRREAIRRIRVLAEIAEGEGIILAHENCSGWGGASAENTLILLAEVNSPALKVLFDTGNPVTYGQDSWQHYCAVRDHIAYVHVKDAKKVNGQDVYTLCGEGEGQVHRILSDLLEHGYDGGISIEPHLAAVIHTGKRSQDAAQLFDSYIRYGRALMKIVQDIGVTQTA
jgi:sugar phosphate isomerase/epimerase